MNSQAKSKENSRINNKILIFRNDQTDISNDKKDLVEDKRKHKSVFEMHPFDFKMACNTQSMLSEDDHNLVSKTKSLSLNFDVANMLCQSINLENDLLNYLTLHNLDNIADKIKKGVFTSKQFINFSDESILELIEMECRHKFPKLRDFIMRLNDQNEALNMSSIINQGLDYSK